MNNQNILRSDKTSVSILDKHNQTTSYSKEELTKLRKFVETVINDESRATLACWGNHDNYSRGY